MRKFKVGKMYGDHAVKFEIVGRTDKTVSFVKVQHVGRFNEKKSEVKKAKLFDWETREVFFSNDETVEA